MSKEEKPTVEVKKKRKSLKVSETNYEVITPVFERYVDTSSIQYTTKMQNNRREILALEDADIYYLQGWFSRISWRKKVNFIAELIKSINNATSIKLLINGLKILNKDLYYATAQTTKFAYDCIPNDDDRSLDQTVLHDVMDNDLTWLKSIDEEKKCKIILDLVKIGGSALAVKAINEAKTLSEIVEVIEYLEKKFGSDDLVPEKELFERQYTDTFKPRKRSFLRSHKRKLSSDLTRIILAEVVKNNKIMPLFDVHKACAAFKPNISNEPELNNLLNIVNSKERLWNDNLRKVLHTVRSGEMDGKSKLRINTSAVDVDHFQRLPLWINQRIIKYLDGESKKSLAKVDFFWKNAVNEEAQENEVRKQLDKYLYKLDSKLLSIKLPGTRFVARIKKQKKPMSADGKGGKSHGKIKRTLSADLTKYFEEPNDLRESVFTLVRKESKSKDLFRGAYNDMHISASYIYDRSIDCTRKYVACTENTSVVLYNLVTGAKAPFTISGHALVVTCVAFFPYSFRIATGSLDNTIKTWDLWNRREMVPYEGHTDVILSLAVNEDYIASCARDDTIRVFSQFSGDTIILIEQTYWTPTMLLLTLDNLVYWVNREGSLKMFSITDNEINKSIPLAHDKGVTFVRKFGPLIVTSGSDLFVRIWNENLSNEKCLLEFFHEVIVNSAVISHLTLITAGIDGCLRFWNIRDSKLFRTIKVNLSYLPILSICIQTYNNHVKILCNNEFNLYVLEFDMKWVKRSKKINPYLGIKLHPLYTRKRTLKKYNRLSKLNKRKCTDAELRSYKTCHKNYNCTLKRYIKEKRSIELFPRCSEMKSESSTRRTYSGY